MKRRVLLVGATGNFGSRLARNLMRVADVSLVVTSRQIGRAEELARAIAEELPGTAVEAAAFDTARDVQEQIAALRPWLVIDATGPFQGADYRLPLAALQSGAHYFDIADARDYLLGFHEALDNLATEMGLVALAGVSSTPALSSAVVAALTKGWRRIDTIDSAITPDGTGDVGAAAVKAVLSYAGGHIAEFRYGAPHRAKGWMNAEVIDMPRLGRRRVAAVETVDQTLFPGAFKVQSRVTFSAGLESPLEMWGLRLLARLRSIGVVPNLAGLTKQLVEARRLTRMTSGLRGGMRVVVTGLDRDGVWSEATWSLLAEKGQGLNVPGLPAVAATRLLLAGALDPGAKAACGDIPLAAIEAEFEGLAISTQQQKAILPRAPFWKALAQEGGAGLPEAVVRFHDLTASPAWQGVGTVRRSRNLLARFAGWCLGLPPSAENVPVIVTVERQPDGEERWTRNFGGHRFHSHMSLARDGKIWERFGALRFQLGLTVKDGRLFYPITRGRAFGVPLPSYLLPLSDTHETADAAGRFCFDVRIGLPLAGPLVRYDGWLEPRIR